MRFGSAVIGVVCCFGAIKVAGAVIGVIIRPCLSILFLYVFILSMIAGSGICFSIFIVGDNGGDLVIVISIMGIVVIFVLILSLPSLLQFTIIVIIVDADVIIANSSNYNHRHRHYH